MNDKRKEYLKKWREDNKEHIREYKKEYSKTHDSSFKKLQDKYKQMQQENKELKNKIKELIKYGFGTDMSLGEFKEFYKLATGKDYDPKKCPEVE